MKTRRPDAPAAAGWARPTPAADWHHFADGAARSDCGTWPRPDKRVVVADVAREDELHVCRTCAGGGR